MKLRAVKTAVSQRVAVILLSLTIGLGACTTPSNSVPTNTPNPIPTATLQPTAAIAPTATAVPASTPLPESSPTVAVNTLANSGVGVCPAVKPELVPDFSAALATRPRVRVPSLEQPALDFLNQGGSPEALATTLRANNFGFWEEDITGDGIPELGITDFELHVLGCRNGFYYVPAFEAMGSFRNTPLSAPLISEVRYVKDINLDGVPEVVIYSYVSCGFTGICPYLGIFEWNGQEFKLLTRRQRNGPTSLLVGYGLYEVEFIDTNGDGKQEMILHGKMPTGAFPYYSLPYRIQDEFYNWNGNFLELYRTISAPAEYRFQAVQDGDEATRWGEYDRALSIYQEAIFSGKLEWWTSARQDYELELWYYQRQDPLISTPPPAPQPDPAEYNNLAAYARYRIMLLHVKQSHISDAKTVYDTLQTKFPAGTAGHAYAEMAQEFWQSYSANQDLGLACAKAIDYAKTYPLEVLTYLGNIDHSTIAINYHGWQSYDYKPEDVCPFK